MKENDNQIERKILDAARTVFIRKGYDGARMQEIADEAGINKSLLHYYFRNKEKLFMSIFMEAIQTFIPRVGVTLISDIPLIQKIEVITDIYITMLKQNPHIPMFILHELQNRPEFFVDILKNKVGINPETVNKQILLETNQGKIRFIDTKQLIVSVISMCIFPFAAKPMLMAMIFNNDEKEWDIFLEERKKFIPDLIKESLKIK